VTFARKFRRCRFATAESGPTRKLSREDRTEQILFKASGSSVSGAVRWALRVSPWLLELLESRMHNERCTSGSAPAKAGARLNK
jgi:hypothetical protein